MTARRSLPPVLCGPVTSERLESRRNLQSFLAGLARANRPEAYLRKSSELSRPGWRGAPLAETQPLPDLIAYAFR